MAVSMLINGCPAGVRWFPNQEAASAVQVSRQSNHRRGVRPPERTRATRVGVASVVAHPVDAIQSIRVEVPTEEEPDHRHQQTKSPTGVGSVGYESPSAAPSKLSGIPRSSTAALPRSIATQSLMRFDDVEVSILNHTRISAPLEWPHHCKHVIQGFNGVLKGLDEHSDLRAMFHSLKNKPLPEAQHIMTTYINDHSCQIGPKRKRLLSSSH